MDGANFGLQSNILVFFTGINAEALFAICTTNDTDASAMIMMLLRGCLPPI